MEWQLIFSLVMLILVLIMTYYITAFIARHGGGFGKSNYMQVIDRLSVDRNNTLVIVKIAEDYQVLLVNAHNSLNLGVIDALDEKQIIKKDFSVIYDKFLKKKGVNENE